MLASEMRSGDKFLTIHTQRDLKQPLARSNSRRGFQCGQVKEVRLNKDLRASLEYLQEDYSLVAHFVEGYYTRQRAMEH